MRVSGICSVNARSSSGEGLSNLCDTWASSDRNEDAETGASGVENAESVSDGTDRPAAMHDGGPSPAAHAFRRLGLVLPAHLWMGRPCRQVARATGRRFVGA